MLSPLKSFHLLINSQSGSVIKAGAESIRELIASSGLPVASLQMIEPDHFNDKLNSFMGDDRAILIGGGDGTIAGCLPHFIDTGRTLGILPLGTMNLLARDLGFSGDMKEALAQYAKPTVTEKIDVAYVNDEPFLCCAGLGTMPESAVFRESMRGESDLVLYPKLIKFVFDQMDVKKQRRVALHMDGRRKNLHTAAIVVSNNRFLNHQDDTSDNFLQRASLQDGLLGVYSFAPRSLKDKLSFALRLRFGGWKNNTRLREWQARDVTLDDPAAKELVSIDGEVKEMQMPLRFHIKPQCLSVMRPKEAGA